MSGLIQAVLCSVVALLWFAWTTPAHAYDTKCDAIFAMQDYDPAEQAALHDACKTGKLAELPLAAAALRVDDWRAVFFAQQIAPYDQRLPLPASGNFGAFLKCKKVRGAIENAVSSASNVDLTRPYDKCMKAADPQATFRHIDLFTYDGEPAHVRLWQVDTTGKPRWIRPRAHPKGGAYAPLVRGERMIAALERPGMTVPEVHTLAEVEISIPKKQPTHDCIEVSIRADPTKAAPKVVIDGHLQALDPKSVVRDKEKNAEFWRQTFDVPDQNHDVTVILDDDAPYYTRVQRPEKRKRGCLQVAFDLSERAWSSHYGIAGVTVNEACTARGLLPDRVRAYNEAFVERFGGKIVQLDAWAEIIDDFSKLQTSFDDGAKIEADTPANPPLSRDRLGERTVMRDLARRLTSQGINALLYVDLVCSELGVEVSGKTVNLNELAKKDLVGSFVEDDDILLMRSSFSSFGHLRNAMEAVLGYIILDKKKIRPGHIEFDYVPDRVRRGSNAKLQVSAVNYGRSDSLETLHVMVRRHVNETGCDKVEELNTLATTEEPAAFLDGFQQEKQIWRLSRNVRLGGLKAGTYVLLAVDGRRSAALCFQVTEANIQGFVTLSGFQQQRGRYPRINPRTDQMSYVRTLAGVRYQLNEFVELGAEVGYEGQRYAASVPPSWDGSGAPSGPTQWRRDGFLLGGVVGARVPLSYCSYVKKEVWLKQYCRGAVASTMPFVELHIIPNFGRLDLSGIPGQTSGGDFNLDIQLDGGVRVTPAGGSFTTGIFLGALFTDVSQARNLASASDYDYDWAIRFILGLEMAWGVDTRRPGR